MTTASDEELIEATLAGRGNAFAELVRRHERRVESTIRSVLGNVSQDDLADLAQDIFLLVYNGLGSFRGASLFSTWLTRIALRHCFREQKRRRRKGLIFLRIRNDSDSRSLEETYAASGSADRSILLEERRSAVVDALYKLPEEFRTVLILRIVEEMPVEQLAEALGVSTGTVKSRLHRAKGKMRDLLQGQDVEFALDAA